MNLQTCEPVNLSTFNLQIPDRESHRRDWKRAPSLDYEHDYEHDYEYDYDHEYDYELRARCNAPLTIYCLLFTVHSPTGTAFTADRKLSGWSPNRANTISPDDGVVWFSMSR